MNGPGKYIMALDQGTTSSRCIIFDHGREISCAQLEYAQIYPKSGWVEHNPYDIWQSQYYTMNAALQKIGASYADIAAIGITNQRETTLVWDKTTGIPLYNAIVWQCRRSSDVCEKIKAQGEDFIERIRLKTGLLPDAYFSATKLMWLFEHVDGLYQKADSGCVAFGTVDTWLVWLLTEGRLHITDYTNASRTMLFNINTLAWDEELLREWNIPPSVLPSVLPSSAFYGYTSAAVTGGAEVPICAIAGDQQAALYGQGCHFAGEIKNTYGTGCFMLINTGSQPVFSKCGLLTTIACNSDGNAAYALEGSVFSAGSAVQWLRDGLGLIGTSEESETAALSVADSGGVYMVPAFTGMGAPYWDSSARGMICGITRGTTKNHIVRAVLEAIAYQSCDVLSLLESETGMTFSQLRVDGGASRNNFLMQLQSDLIAKPVYRPAYAESTAYGAALLAARAADYEMKSEYGGTFFIPSMSKEQRSAMLSGWKRAAARAMTNY